jgi:hypothetical protein
MFLDVQQVVAQYSFDRSASISSTDWNGDFTGGPAATVAGRWAESPTITYTPMTGEKFTRSLLRPIDPANIFSLIQSGMPIDAVFSVGVKSINGLNAGSQAEILRRTADPEFYRVVSLMRELQDANEFGLSVKDKPDNVIVMFRRHQAEQARPAASVELRQLLHLSPDAEQFNLRIGSVAANDQEIALLTRSMLEILTEMSAGVEVPELDLKEGRANKMEPGANPSGTSIKVRLRVRSSKDKPSADEAFTAVQYRNHWFWVDDRDLSSKRGLSFLMILFTLAESGNPPPPPTLTLSKP